MRAVHRAVLLSLCLVLLASSTASCARHQLPTDEPPDCSDPAACLCPWRSVLRLDDFEALQESLIPHQIVRCPQQGDCSWRVRAPSDGVRIDHRRPEKKLVAPVADGSIVAHNNGEHGAALFWLSGMARPAGCSAIPTSTISSSPNMVCSRRPGSTT